MLTVYHIEQSLEQLTHLDTPQVFMFSSTPDESDKIVPY